MDRPRRIPRELRERPRDSLLASAEPIGGWDEVDDWSRTKYVEPAVLRALEDGLRDPANLAAGQRPVDGDAVRPLRLPAMRSIRTAAESTECPRRAPTAMSTRTA